MAVKKGFKLTEVGEIPEDWEVKQIKNIAFIDPELLSAITPKDYSFQYISLEDVKDGKLKSYERQIFCTAPSRARKKVQHGDILFGTVRPNLHSHLLFSMDGEDWICSTGFAVLRAFEGYDNRFIFHNFLYEEFDRQINSIISGSNYPAVNTKQIRNLNIPIPPSYQEQTTIASAISDIDSLITSFEQLIAKKRLIKQGAMQELLTGKRRLPGFEGEWKNVNIGRMGTIITGRTPDLTNLDYWGNDYPWVTPSDIGSSLYISRTERMLSEIGIKSTIFLPSYTVLITCIASIGKNTILKVAGSCNQQINAIIVNQNYDYLFIYFLISFFSKKLIDVSGITATRIVSKKIFEEIAFSVPTKKEQSVIAAVLSDMDAEIAALEAKLEKTRKIKAGMMNELLTGRIRLL